jgi:hypothetical protein
MGENDQAPPWFSETSVIQEAQSVGCSHPEVICTLCADRLEYRLELHIRDQRIKELQEMVAMLQVLL